MSSLYIFYITLNVYLVFENEIHFYNFKYFIYGKIDI